MKSREMKSSMNAFWVIGAVAAGAVVMYFLDPSRGHRRRALVRDQVVSKSHRLRREMKRFSEDLGNRAYGTLTEMSSRQHVEALSDDTLNQRVRAAFGREIRHPKSIQSFVTNGVVTLAGPILESEVRKILRCARKVPGVRGVINQLDVHEHAEKIPGLQGNGPKYLQ